ncbi:ABC transporter substrate-binding protein [Nocardia inohanensis]|uniref:ABC transporter substrate-binding protein n=1 Tax=Nocardia inohanensis TaxID=209246 RepID=UPI000A07B38F|nr:ABC transporter substrate-binding protein [Nocardia inohanensis]
MARRTTISLAALAVTCAITVGCAAPEPSANGKGDAAERISVDNCGSRITLDAPPERILLVNNDALPNLEALDAVGNVVALTTRPQAGLYRAETNATLERLTPLTAAKNATGGSIISKEAVLGVEPDLVIAPENAVDRGELESAGIAVFSPTAYCLEPGADLTATATFDRVWSEMRSLGTLLGKKDLAEKAVTETPPMTRTPAPQADAAALYVASGGAALSAYGASSMVTPVFEAAGLRNVYLDFRERVFDINVEDLIARDPDTIVLLHNGDPQQTIDNFRTNPGVSGLSAVRAGRVVALAFPYTDPPSMLSVQGPRVLAESLAALP